MYKLILKWKKLMSLVILVVVLTASTGVLAAEYLVRPGDSLWKISQKYGVTVGELKAANGLSSDTIYAGETIEVPETKSVATSTRAANIDIELLARMISAEAKGEPYVGQVAVGAVILNRVESPLFPNTLEGVIYQPGQFEPVMNGTLWNPPTEEARRAALEAVAGWDPTGGALYFFNPAKANNSFLWSRPYHGRIGNHVFMG